MKTKTQKEIKRFQANNASRSIAKYIIFILILIGIGSVIGLGFNFINNNFLNKKSTSEPVVKDNTVGKNIGGINYSTDLPESALNYISNTVTNVYQNEYKPTALEIKLVTKAEETGDVYVGTWAVNSKAFFVLYVTGTSNNAPRYIRTWALDTGANVNQKLAETSITEYFNKGYIDQVGSLACSDIVNPESPDSGTIKDCAAVASSTSGDKLGISVRAPILIQTSEKGTSTAACFVPKETAASYLHKTCI